MKPERTFRVRQWDRSNLVLVGGEVVAVLAAVAALVFALCDWDWGRWFLYGAAILAAGALAWYAVDRSSQGDMPLTGFSARRIARVAKIVVDQNQLGFKADWDTITPDGAQVKMSILGMSDDAKRALVQVTLGERAGDPDAAADLVRHMAGDQIDEMMKIMGLDIVTHQLSEV